MTATTITSAVTPTLGQLLAGMSAALGGPVPAGVGFVSTAMPGMVFKHAQDGGFAMPQKGCDAEPLFAKLAQKA